MFQIAHSHTAPHDSQVSAACSHVHRSSSITVRRAVPNPIPLQDLPPPLPPRNRGFVIGSVYENVINARNIHSTPQQVVPLVRDVPNTEKNICHTCEEKLHSAHLQERDETEVESQLEDGEAHNVVITPPDVEPIYKPQVLTSKEDEQSEEESKLESNGISTMLEQDIDTKTDTSLPGPRPVSDLDKITPFMLSSNIHKDSKITNIQSAARRPKPKKIQIPKAFLKGSIDI